MVKDSPTNRLVIQSYLKDTPYQVDTAENGKVGMEQFKTGAYDLVLMDVQMPVMDGYEATKAIRQWERTEGLVETPIIALTANAMREDVERSAAAGCNTHLSKSIKREMLMQSIQSFSGEVMN